MNRVVDSRSDLHSLGVTLYELFTAHLPFETCDALELVHAHIARTPPNPRTHRIDLPQALADIVAKLMAKAAEERYQSAVGVEHDLARCLEQLQTTGTIAPFQLATYDKSVVTRYAPGTTALGGRTRVQSRKQSLLLRLSALACAPATT